jgi:molybdopterin/thiamine biosynthesis adenylyltransferase
MIGDARARLRETRVLIVGVGGLGAPAALQLAACGVGTIGLLDCDAVEISNLQRQIIYRTIDIGQRKVDAASRRLQPTCPETALRTFDIRLTAENLPSIFRDFDFVIDGTDTVESKFLVNDGAIALGIPFSHAGILGFRGQTLTVIPRRSACLRCLFPLPPSPDEIPTCQSAGIIGALAGSIGLIQAGEALKFLLNEGELLTNRLLTYDAARQRWRTVELSVDPQCPACGEPAG